MKPFALALRSVAVLAVPFTVLACSSAAPDEEDASSEEALSKAAFPGGPAGPIGGKLGPVGPVNPGPPGLPPANPPASPQYCPAVDPSCTIQFGDAQGFATMNQELAAYGCAPVQQWFTGYSAGWLGGLVALCTDSAALRQHYPQFNFTAMVGACDKCIPKAPVGQVWIELSAFVGPNCQSGCRGRSNGWGG